MMSRSELCSRKMNREGNGQASIEGTTPAIALGKPWETLVRMANGTRTRTAVEILVCNQVM